MVISSPPCAENPSSRPLRADACLQVAVADAIESRLNYATKTNHKTTRRAMSKATAGAALTVFISVLLTIGVSAGAQSFPAKPVRLVVGFSAGGGARTHARGVSK